MSAPTPKYLSEHLSRRLANLEIDDQQIADLTKRLQVDGLRMGRLGICSVGICVDYLARPDFDWKTVLVRPGLRHVEIFPYGIIEPERLHVRLSFDASRGGRFTR
jgi:hypothetical protein